MKRYEYKVLKPFTIIRENNKHRLTKNESEKQKGSSFKTQSQYVDYEMPKIGFEMDTITKKLIRKGYIELVSETKIG